MSVGANLVFALSSTPNTLVYCCKGEHKVRPYNGCASKLEVDPYLSLECPGSSLRTHVSQIAGIERERGPVERRRHGRNRRIDGL